MNIIEIKDINAPALTLFSGMSEVQLYRYNEPEPGIFMAESANVILCALEAGYDPLSFLVEKERLETEGEAVFRAMAEIRKDLKTDYLPVYTAEREILKNLTGYELVRGLWGAMKRKALPDLWSFCKDKDRIAVLYDVVNPTNVGAMIRSAAALGMDGALLSHASVDPLTRRSARVSMGTVFKLPWNRLSARQSEVNNLIPLLKELNYTTVSMALTKDTLTPDDSLLKEHKRLAVILGTEGTGLPEEIIKESDHRVMIPMHHGVDSLNVAAAGAVIFWELSKK